MPSPSPDRYKGRDDATARTIGERRVKRYTSTGGGVGRALRVPSACSSWKGYGLVVVASGRPKLAACLIPAGTGSNNASAKSGRNTRYRSNWMSLRST